MNDTILISSFHPLILRNILSTPLITLLAKGGVGRIVILCHEKKREFFNKHITDKRVVIEGIEVSPSWRDILFSYFAMGLVRTRTLDLKRRTEMRGSGKMLALLFGNMQFIRPFFRWASGILTPRTPFDKLIERYQPTLVFATDIQNPFDVRLLHEANRHGVRTVGMVRAWDNLKSKGLMRHIPERLIVHNNILKREAVELNGVSEKHIEVIGIPHYDTYRNSISKYEAFCSQIGAQASRPIILFAPTGDRYLSHNTVDRDIVNLLHDILPSEYQILVRLPPTDTVEILEEAEAKFPGRVILDRRPSEFKSRKSVELTEDDDRHLQDSLYWSKLVIAGPSTMCIDAAFYDKPVILTVFDGYEKRPYLESVARYFDYDHWDAVKESGGAVFARSEEEFKNAVGRYLNEPRLDHDGRVSLVKAECVYVDGKSTERLAQVLLRESLGEK